MKKYRGVKTHYGNHQCTPFFATVQEVSEWEKENGVESDAVMPVANWRDVQKWQNDPTNYAHYREQGAWEVLS